LKYVRKLNMDFVWRAFYNVIITPLFCLSARVYSLFNSKAREGLRGRKVMFDNISEQASFGRDRTHRAPILWFHCASVGEFEQARPIIAAFEEKKTTEARRHREGEEKKSDPSVSPCLRGSPSDGRARIVVSFFSPSGYNAAANYTHADLVCYLPFDTAMNARRMFQLIDPSILIFVKFDVWPNYVWTAAKMHVPVILADATLHGKSKRLWPVARSFLKSVHKHINLHCAISAFDAQRLERICPKDARILVTGDTRFDQVIARRGSAGKKLKGLLPQFEAPVIIAGSTYIEDERVVIDAYQKVLAGWGEVQLVLVPHEPEPDRLAEIDALMSQRSLPYILLSQIEKGAELNSAAIVVDRVGVLAELYLLGDITFIGGSFHGSVHNVMEPAVMGKPVLFGPTIHNSLEAMMLRERGAGIMIKDSEEMASELVRLLSDDELRERLGKAAQALIEENAGATEKIISCIDEFLR
jgi:3-deoxy-D-manno-octulosonic-acid transferase